MRWPGVVAACFAVVFSASTAWPCQSDSDCKGDRVCESGKCVAPPDAPKKVAPKAKKKAKPETHDDPPPEPPKKKVKVAATEEDQQAPSSPEPAKEVEPERPIGHEHTSGLAAGIGLGFQTSGAGFLAAYYIKLGGPYFLTPYVGAGIYPDKTKDQSGSAFGLMLVAGQRHRAVLDVGYGLAGIVKSSRLDSNFNTVTSVETAYGVTGGFGYEFLGSSGFFFRAEFGVTFVTSSNWPESSAQPTLALGMGVKLW